ncbi:MAG: kelch repeat-containing protein, partial [Myxococcota bacterium]
MRATREITLGGWTRLSLRPPPTHGIDRGGIALGFRLVEAGGTAVTKAASVTAEDHGGGRLFFPDAVAGADALVQTRRDGVEDVYFWATPPSRPQLRYALDVRDAPALRLVGRTLEVLDAAGYPRLRVAPPVVLTGEGQRVAASLEISGCAVDRDPRPAAARSVPAPGVASCWLDVTWPPWLPHPIAVDPTWEGTTDLAVARFGHEATAVDPTTPGSAVLITGGFDATGIALDAVELFQPTAGTYTALAPMGTARGAHAAVALQDPNEAGRVMVLGGASLATPTTPGALTAATEIWSPMSGVFQGSVPMPEARYEHTATRVDGGVVLLVVGGRSGPGLPPSAATRRFDVTAGTYDPAVTMTVPRTAHTATWLANSNSVLVAGGLTATFATATAELLDASGSLVAWTATANAAQDMNAVRAFHTATGLPDGSVVITGGSSSASDATITDAVSVFVDDGSTQRGFINAGNMTAPRTRHIAVALPGDRVVVAGGVTTGGSTLDATELFDPDTLVFTPLATATLPEPVSDAAAAAITLKTGPDPALSALVNGGRDVGGGGTVSAASAIFDRGNGAPCTVAAECRSGFCATPGCNGSPDVGVCCDEACDGECASCCAAQQNAGGQDGTCDDVADGTVIRVDCIDEVSTDIACSAGAATVATSRVCTPAVCGNEGLCTCGCETNDDCTDDGFCDVTADPVAVCGGATTPGAGGASSGGGGAGAAGGHGGANAGGGGDGAGG